MEFKNHPMEDYLKPHMSQEDYDFLWYMVWLQDQFTAAAEKDPNAKPHADLLDAQKVRKWRSLGLLKNSVMCSLMDQTLEELKAQNDKGD
jgi:hypothetical protein